jgi:hypothetical protein
MKKVKDLIPRIISKMIKRALLPSVSGEPKAIFEKIANNKMLLRFSLNQYKNPEFHPI